MTEAVVVGGGLAGTAVALALRERGAAVTVVESERPGAAATGASAGMLAPQYESARDDDLFHTLLRARTLWPAFAEKVQALSGASLGMRRDGMLVANLDEAEDAAARESARWQTAAGARAKVVGPDDARAMQPGIGDGAVSYLWLPDEGQVDTQALAEALPLVLERAGVRVVSGRRVAEVRIAGDAVEGVRLEDGRTMGADLVVVAAGAWSARLGGLPRPVPVHPVRGHILRFAAGTADLSRIVAGHAGRYVVPRADGTVLAGSTMDEVGFYRGIDDAGLRVIHDEAARLVPALGGARPMEWWADLRPVAVDGKPIVGPDPEVRGLSYATGFGRNGILLSPLAAELLVARVMDGARAEAAAR